MCELHGVHVKILSYPLIFLIRIYQLIISPWLDRSAVSLPSCSVYAIEHFGNMAY